MSDDFLTALEADPFPQADKRQRHKHPEGMTPGLDTEKGTFITRSMEQLDIGKITGDFATQLEAAGFDPSQWRLEDDRIEVRTWPLHMGAGKKPVTAYYFKAKILRLDLEQYIDYDELIEEIKTHPPLEPQLWGREGEWNYVVNLADWQLGKRDGDGTEGIVKRILAGLDEVADDVARCALEGWGISRIIIAGLGDLVEGCDGFYPMQTFNVELDRRGQVRVARRLLLHALRVLAPLTPAVTVVCVGGNHGENRKNGKSFTTFSDNDDVAIFEMVQEILAENPDAYGHVKWLIPNDELAVTVQAGATVLGFTHGHLGGRQGVAGLSHTKVWNWWRDQSFGDTPIGDADVLVNGHFHYFNWCINGPRNHIQTPALDSSTWFEQSTGMGTQHGIVTFLTGPTPVERLRIHPCIVVG